MKLQPAVGDLVAEPAGGAAQHHRRHFDPVDLAAVVQAVKQKAETNTTPETDIGYESTRRDRQRIHCGRHVLAIAEVESHAHQATDQPARMSGLPCKPSEDPALHVHDAILRRSRGALPIGCEVPASAAGAGGIVATVASGTRFDVLVVGGGSAGCVLAARLSEEPGRRVCLVEAGPDYGAHGDGRWPADMLDARWLAFSHSWETDRDDRSQLRARIIGGCSAHNACIVIAGEPADYDEWGEGWSHAAIEPYLRRAELELAVRRFEEEQLSPWHRAFAEAAGADAIVHMVNAIGAIRWNAAFAYLDPARARRTSPSWTRRWSTGCCSTATGRSASPPRAARSGRGWSCSPPAPTGRRASCCAAASAPSAGCRSARG